MPQRKLETRVKWMAYTIPWARNPLTHGISPHISSNTTMTWNTIWGYSGVENKRCEVTSGRNFQLRHAKWEYLLIFAPYPSISKNVIKVITEMLSTPGLRKNKRADKRCWLNVLTRDRWTCTDGKQRVSRVRQPKLKAIDGVQTGSHVSHHRTPESVRNWRQQVPAGGNWNWNWRCRYMKYLGPQVPSSSLWTTVSPSPPSRSWFILQRR